MSAMMDTLMSWREPRAFRALHEDETMILQIVLMIGAALVAVASLVLYRMLGDGNWTSLRTLPALAALMFAVLMGFKAVFYRFAPTVIKLHLWWIGIYRSGMVRTVRFRDIDHCVIRPVRLHGGHRHRMLVVHHAGGKTEIGIADSVPIDRLVELLQQREVDVRQEMQEEVHLP